MKRARELELWIMNGEWDWEVDVEFVSTACTSSREWESEAQRVNWVCRVRVS